MPKFNIAKSIQINAPESQVRACIQNYNEGPVWSPWLLMEPEAKIEFEGTAATIGHAYSWEGDMVGAGRMELSKIDDSTDHMDLQFLKPFKSKAAVGFTTKAIDANNTNVEWTMASSLPFFLFFMVGNMKAMIGMDYNRGLKLLKEYVESGATSSITQVQDVVDFTGTHYQGLQAKSSMQNIEESMGKTFATLANAVADKATADFLGTVYDKMDIKNQHCEYTAFAPVAESNATNNIPACRAVKVVHTGSYEHLGNAWSTAYTYQRHNKLKLNKSIKPFELYLNHPDNVPAKELITEIYLPLKA